MKKTLYKYAKAGTLEGHFSDDVAVTYADTVSEAIEKFSSLYEDVTEENVSPVHFDSYDVAILTEY